MSTGPFPGGQAPLPPAKKSNVLFILIAVVVVLFVVVGAVVLVGGYLVARKVQQAGFDPELMRKNPGMAVAKMLAAANPDVEVVEVNDARGVITLRDKKTGKTVKMDLEQARQGRISFEGEGGEKVTIEGTGEGESGAARITSPQGTMEIGSNLKKLPGWVPEYPGVASKGGMSINSTEGNTGSFSFETGDSAEQVAGFYDKVLQREGFKVTKTLAAEAGAVHGEKAGRNLVVVIGQQGGNRTVNVTFTEK